MRPRRSSWFSSSTSLPFCSCAIAAVVIPNNKPLAAEWDSLGAEDKAIRRAQRARRGERCSECGLVGYFRRNCPTCPPVRYSAVSTLLVFLSARICFFSRQFHYQSKTNAQCFVASAVSCPITLSKVRRSARRLACGLCGRDRRK